MIRLLVDLGNTRLKWCLREADEQSAGALAHDGRAFASELPLHLWKRVERIMVASVAGSALNQHLARELASVSDYQVWAITPRHSPTLVNGYRDHRWLGVDRWLALLAAVGRCGTPVCVIDCGSAITADFVDAQSRHQGGLILPGVSLMLRALSGNTARLAGNYQPDFSALPGDGTHACIERGVGCYLQGLVQRVEAWRADQGGTVPLVLCGGDAPLLASRFSGLRVDLPDAVFDGLDILLSELQARESAG